jgi:D-arabinose 1-dehydrogenase-like Zn-dependent alcohol dehydrogenase
MELSDSSACQKKGFMFNVERRDPGPYDIHIDILYAGICHSDLHQARNYWGNSSYPMVPGHEIVGKVVAVGADRSRGQQSAEWRKRRR